MPANLENSAVATGLLRPVFIPMKRSVLIPIPKKGSTKECSNYCTIALVSLFSKVMLKILQGRRQQYMNHINNLRYAVDTTLMVAKRS